MRRGEGRTGSLVGDVASIVLAVDGDLAKESVCGHLRDDRKEKENQNVIPKHICRVTKGLSRNARF